MSILSSGNLLLHGIKEVGFLSKEKQLCHEEMVDGKRGLPMSYLWRGMDPEISKTELWLWYLLLQEPVFTRASVTSWKIHPRSCLWVITLSHRSGRIPLDHARRLFVALSYRSGKIHLRSHLSTIALSHRSGNIHPRSHRWATALS